MKEYTESELENIYAAVKDMVSMECDKLFIREFRAVGSKDQPLNLLSCYCCWQRGCFNFSSGEVVCKYRSIFSGLEADDGNNQREYNYHCVLCSWGSQGKKMRTCFDCPTVIGHDNIILNW